METTSMAAVQTRNARRDRWVTANGLRIHYLEWGEAGGPAVPLLHGLTGNAWE